MVRCKAHNLETENACVGSIPTPATNFICCRRELLHYKEFNQIIKILSSFVTMKFAEMGQWSTPLDL